jgi:hypothetical protein
MPVIHLIVIIAVIGVLLWAINTYVPMDETVKKILNAVVVIALVVWLLVWIFAITGIANYKLPMPS